MFFNTSGVANILFVTIMDVTMAIGIERLRLQS